VIFLLNEHVTLSHLSVILHFLFNQSSFLCISLDNSYTMLNTISGGSSLPREVLQWLDSLDLSYSVRNPRMDLSNGFLVAEILTRKYPNELSILTFYNAQRKDRKIDNWQQIQKCTLAPGKSPTCHFSCLQLYFRPRAQEVQNSQGGIRIYRQSRP
jgi:hypothetical protein